jgi:glycosyltransferase involved in cell wall biosynthesis
MRVIVVRPTFEFGGIKRYLETLCFHVVEADPSVEMLLLLHPDWRRHWHPGLRHSRCRFHWSATLADTLDMLLPRHRNLAGVRGVARITALLNRSIRASVGLPQTDWHAYIQRQARRVATADSVALWVQPGPQDDARAAKGPLAVLWLDLSEDRAAAHQAALDALAEQWLSRADAALFLSKAVENEARRRYPALNPERCRTLPIPPWLPSFRPEHIEAMRRRLRLRASQRILLLPGRADPRKGQITLLAAAQLLRSRGLGTILPVLCGPGTQCFERPSDDSGVYQREYADAVRSQVALYGWRWGEDLVALGTVTDEEVHALYRLSAVCVFPSVYEGLGLPLQEATLAGTPLVCSDIPVFREQVDSGRVQAELFPVGSAVDLADAVQRVLEQPPPEKPRSGTGTLDYDRASWSAFANQFTGLLRAVRR